MLLSDSDSAVASQARAHGGQGRHVLCQEEDFQFIEEQDRAQLRKLLLDGANSGPGVRADEAFFKRLRKRADA